MFDTLPTCDLKSSDASVSLDFFLPCIFLFFVLLEERYKNRTKLHI